MALADKDSSGSQQRGWTTTAAEDTEGMQDWVCTTIGKGQQLQAQRQQSGNDGWDGGRQQQQMMTATADDNGDG